MQQFHSVLRQPDSFLLSIVSFLLQVLVLFIDRQMHISSHPIHSLCIENGKEQGQADWFYSMLMRFSGITRSFCLHLGLCHNPRHEGKSGRTGLRPGDCSPQQNQDSIERKRKGRLLWATSHLHYKCLGHLSSWVFTLRCPIQNLVMLLNKCAP